MSDMVNKHGLGRRTFLSLSAALSAGAVAGPALRWVMPPAASASILDAGMKVTPSFCEVCFWKCGIDAWTNAQGQLVQITGRANHPLSNGRLCPRGTGGMGQLYDPDRLKQPLLRQGDRWRAVNWDEALGFVARRMEAIRAQWGAESVALINHGHGASFLVHLMRAWGAPVTSAPSWAQCRGPRDAAFAVTYGRPVGSPEFTDIENARFMVLIGSHLGENMHNTQVQEFAAFVERGGELAVADPRFSVAAGKAKWWLPIRPGTDLALLLAWIRLLVYEGTYRKAFVDEHCSGLPELKAAVAPYSPEWAYTQTGIEPEIIREVARRLAMNAPHALVHPGRRTNWYGDDTQRSRAVAILNALLGNYGQPGGVWLGHTFAVGKYPYPPYPKANEAFEARMRTHFPLAAETPTQYLRDHTLAGDEPPIKGWIVYGTDLLNNFPHRDRTIDAIRKLELLVVLETMPIELTGWADVVLPDTTYLERYDDLHTPNWKVPYVAIRQPVVPPLHDSKPSWWIARELGLRLGLEKFFPWKDVEDYLETRLRTAGLSLAELKRKGVVTKEAPPPYTDQPRFGTPTGKVELYSRTLAGLGFDPIPKYTPPDEPPPGFLRLLIGRVPVHSFGRTTNNAVLTEIMAENHLWVNAITARDFGLAHGQSVRLVNQDGVQSDPVRVKVTQRIRPDCVFLPHGFGRRTEKLHIAYHRGTADNDLLTRIVVDPLMGGTSTNTNFVTFVPEARNASRTGEEG